MLGKLELEFGITTHKGSFLKAGIGRIAKEFTTGIETYNKIPYNAMKLNPSGIETPPSFSLLKETKGNAVLSTLKRAEKEDRLVLRVYNPSGQEIEESFTFLDTMVQVAEGNLNEKEITSLTLENRDFQINLKRNQVKTFLIK